MPASLFVLAVFLAFALFMAGVMMIIFSKKLWSPKRMPFGERMDPMTVIGFSILGIYSVAGLFALSRML